MGVELMRCCCFFFFFFSSRRRHTRCLSDWSSDVCSSDLVIPLPFNQPIIASPTSPALAGGPYAQKWSYGYNVGNQQLPDGSDYQANYEGGNVDLRVPYIGYAAESITYKAAGIDDYNALQVHVDKRISHGIQVGASYTWSHALDEQSGLGLFYNGNNPLNLRSAYGSADFDRTHVFNLNYVFQLHDFGRMNTLEGDIVNGWSLIGNTVLQSGQPYSVIILPKSWSWNT